MSKNTTTLNCVRTKLKGYLPEHSLGEFLDARVSREFEPFYSSIDIRDAGYKIAPVDANFYPAGFNNICPDDLESAGEILKPLLKRHLKSLPKRVAILPEAHTKNRFYLDNVLELRQLFRRIGIDCEIGWFEGEGLELESSKGTKLFVHPFVKKGKRLVIATQDGDYDPDFILVNNDFSSGFPAVLDDIEQAIEPSPHFGWHTRKKSTFFGHYNRLAAELAEKIGMDPWCMSVDTRHVKDVDFDQNVGMDKIADAVDSLLENTRKEFAARGIDETPFAFVKSNSGTYGMGILKVESGAELLSLNRRERNKMAVVKNKLEVHDVIVQEGIPTRFQFDGVYAEPAIYLFGRDLMGGFLRKNPERKRNENLNAKGMVFQKLCMSDLRAGADRDMELELVYGTIAQLSAGAMSFEIKDLIGSTHGNS